MVHDCMVYTVLVLRWQQFDEAPAMSALKYTTSVDIKKTRDKKLVNCVEPHASTVSLLKRAENSSIYKRSSINQSPQVVVVFA